MNVPLDYYQLLLLGAVAGFTIFLGLPVAALRDLGPRMRSFLNALSIGILVFLVVDVFGHAWAVASMTALAALAGRSTLTVAVLDLAAMLGGLAAGLLGLAWYESRYMPFESAARADMPSERRHAAGGSASLLGQSGAYRMSMMIAIGIGAHNFSEGLAIGQSYAAGSIGLALLLVVGFGAHNATEGFGIAGPLTGLSQPPRLRFIGVAGLVGGGPTFVGTLLGSLWSSEYTYVLFLSFAGGALVYVSMLMYTSARRQASNSVIMAGIFAGLCLGFLTDLLVSLGGA